MALGAALASIKGQIPSNSPDVADFFSFVSHFRPSEFCTVEGPEAHRAMRADTPEAHRDPRVIPDIVRVPVEMCISSICEMSRSSGKGHER